MSNLPHKPLNANTAAGANANASANANTATGANRKLIYLNNAATSWPKPPGVAEAMAQAIQKLPGAANRGGLEDFNVLDAVREQLAQLLGVSDSERIALAANATWGLNAAIFGLNLQPGDQVLTTTAEHNSVLRPLFVLQRDKGIGLHHLPVNASGKIDFPAWAAALQKLRPRLCVFTHASNVTGAANNVAQLTAAAHDVGAIVLLDLSQTLGWLDCNLDSWNVDMAAFTGHKYLLGPQGTGGLYLRPDLKLQPHLVGGTGIHSDLDTMPAQMPLHLEAGTNNEPGYYGLLAALNWSVDNPVAPLRPSVLALIDTLQQELSSMGARVIDPCLSDCAIISDTDNWRTPVLSFTIDGFIPDALGAALLENYDVIVRSGLHCAPKIFSSFGVDPSQGTVRLSLSRFSSNSDAQIFLQAMQEIVAAGPEWI